MRRSERLFALAEALRARRTGITAEALAARFGVTVRTMYRDLDTLRAASLPLQAERGRGGGYALDRAYALPPVNFTAREATLLIALGRWASELRVLPFTTTLASALDKVRGALPVAGQRQLEALMATVQFVGVPAQASDPQVRAAVERAFFESRALRIEYRGANDVHSVREVRIEGVVLERGETLLNCVDLGKRETRQLRLHRVVRAELIDERSDAQSAPEPMRTPRKLRRARRR